MKRILAIILLLAAFAFTTRAIKAPRTPYTAIQPDGSTIVLVNHGDEFNHWTTTLDGTPVQQDITGRWKPVSMAPRSSRAHMDRARARQFRAEAAESSLSLGEKHFLVLLIEFDDLSFTLDNPQDAFWNLLNEEGYSKNGGTGSVRDFYIDSSSGQFKPTYDVYGPVKLSRSYSYYGENDKSGSDSHPDEALFEACSLLDADLDFSAYDNDHDGYVDNVFFFYAGHNEAEGGGGKTIWPHAWSLFRFDGTFDGVRVWSYACASEYKNSSGKKMCGIGTFTHEFGHVLGLPDFYDTDGSDNGDAETLGSFSTMDTGCYNNDSRTPPRFNAVERNILGWMEDPEPLSDVGPLALESLSQNKAYCSLTSNEGESFIYEVRDGTGWDKPLPAGLVVYHLDMSENQIGGYFTAAYFWEVGYMVNCYAEHPCFYIVPSAGSLWPMEYAIFPGAFDVQSFTPTEWSGVNSTLFLENIAVDQAAVNCTLSENPVRLLNGRITDSFGLPIEGAQLIASRKEAGVHAASAPCYGATSGSDGLYSLELSTEHSDGTFTITAFAEGYASSSIKLDMRLRAYMEQDFVLEPGEGNEDALAILGFNSLASPAGLLAGDTFNFEVISAPENAPLSVMWYWDGSPASGTSVTLTSGSHTLKAVQSFEDRTEELFLEFNID